MRPLSTRSCRRALRGDNRINPQCPKTGKEPRIFTPVYVGILIGASSLLPLSVYGIRITVLLGVLIMVSASLAAVGAIGLARLAASRLVFAPRAAKFALVGTMNTLFELSFITAAFLWWDHTAQKWFPLFKTASFLVASGNAYFWNRTWTFASGHAPSMREYLLFLGANILGLLINISVASFLVNVIGAPTAVAPVIWANISIIMAVLAATGFNFLSQGKIFRMHDRAPHR